MAKDSFRGKVTIEFLQERLGANVDYSCETFESQFLSTLLVSI